MIKIIENKSSKNMLEFEDMFRNAKNGADEYNGEGTHFDTDSFSKRMVLT